MRRYLLNLTKSMYWIRITYPTFGFENLVNKWWDRAFQCSGYVFFFNMFCEGKKTHEICSPFPLNYSIISLWEWYHFALQTPKLPVVSLKKRRRKRNTVSVEIVSNNVLNKCFRLKTERPTWHPFLETPGKLQSESLCRCQILSLICFL